MFQIKTVHNGIQKDGIQLYIGNKLFDNQFFYLQIYTFYELILLIFLQYNSV